MFLMFLSFALETYDSCKYEKCIIQHTHTYHIISRCTLLLSISDWWQESGQPNRSPRLGPLGQALSATNFKFIRKGQAFIKLKRSIARLYGLQLLGDFHLDLEIKMN